MGDYATLKAGITANIKQNDSQLITGAVLQGQLLAMVNELGAGYQFMGVATPDSPGEDQTPDIRCFYIAVTPGTYTHLGNVVVEDGEVAILKYDSAWTKVVTGVASADEVRQLAAKVVEIFETQSIDLSTFSISAQHYSEFAIPLVGGTQLRLKITTNDSASVRIYGIKSDNTYAAITSGYTPITANVETTIDFSPSEDFVALALYFPSTTTATSGTGLIKRQDDYATEEDLQNAILPLATKTEVNDATQYRKNNWNYASAILTQSGFIRPNGSEESNSAYVRSDYLLATGAKKFIVTGKFVSAIAPIAYYKADKTFISAESVSTTGIQTVTSNVPANAVFIRVSTFAANVADFYIDAILGSVEEIQKPSILFMSPLGDDSNPGTETLPVKTFAAAKSLLRDGGELFMLPGDYDFLTCGVFNLSDFAKVTGIGKVRIIYHTQVIDSATLVSGNIYKVTYSPLNAENLNTLTQFIYIHDVPDPDTAILTEEINPLQRGKTHRLPSTRMYKVASIAEIESETSHPCWYYDGTDIYFSLPAGVNLAVNPIIIPPRGILSATEKRTVEIRNIEILYMQMLLTGLSGLLENVSCGMGRASAGQIRCDYCKDLVLRNCEAYAAHTTSGGDGVNTHNTDTSISDQSRIVLENCWLHDNGDDGESCHENSLTIHKGGLVEYNGNGITPASGGGTECHGVLVRNNGNHPWVQDNGGTGFSSQGGVMTCFNCVSENNTTGYNKTSTGRAIAYNCVAKGNTSQYSGVTQVNCVSIE